LPARLELLPSMGCRWRREELVIHWA
jgi:hypothetical protein